MALPLQRSFDDLGTPLHDVTFCVVDLETTGGSANTCEITEIGAVKVRGGHLLGTFQTLVDPGMEIPPSIVILTGITQAMVINAPPIDEALPAFLEFCGDAIVVGHNVRFDLSFLNAAAERLGYGRLTNRSVDTAALARRLIRQEVRNLRLSSLAAHFRSPVTPNHRALADAEATTHVLHALLERAGTLGVTALEDLLLLPRARGSAYYEKIHLARELPRAPGVYLFRDRNGTVIYVGKAKNLRTRVSSYFYGDERRSVANLLREMDSIDHRVCAGDLDASITELRLIHANRPRHNRRSKPPKANHWVTLTSEPFPRLSITRTIHRDALTTLGPFRSRRHAELVLTALWDALPVRRCTGRSGSRDGPCAPAQLGVAMCPCDGSLDEAVYRRVTDQLIEGIERAPALLLDRIEERMLEHAIHQRFEEAGWLRDRHRALATAIERRQAWQALVAAGRLELSDGRESVSINSGRLVAAWRTSDSTPLLPLFGEADESGSVPPTVGAAEEAHLIWKWLCRSHTRIVEADGPIALPASGIPQLAGAA
jgi:DNA polymerase-3 subunit epsilon